MYNFSTIKKEKDRQDALHVYLANLPYFKLNGEPVPDINTIIADGQNIPPHTPRSAKHYELVRDEKRLIGVIDVIAGYPDAKTLYFGLLLTTPHVHGFGTNIVNQLATLFAQLGLNRMELAVVASNKPAYAFWQQLGFTDLRKGEAAIAGNKTVPVIVMEKPISR